MPTHYTLAANLSMLYPEHAFLDRFGAAAADGFAAVEYLFPYAHEPDVLAGALKQHGLVQALFNAPPGGLNASDAQAAWELGDRGTASVPGRQSECQAGVALALRYAAALGNTRVHVMAGLLPAGASADTVARHHATYVSNLRAACAMAAPHGVTVLIEPINTRDMPGYFLNRQRQAHDIAAEVGANNLAVQLDLYHCQIMEGDLIRTIERDLPTGRVGHVQIAGVPDRHEPDGGEINYPAVLAALDRVAADCGWHGYVGCEYRPARGAVPGGTTAGLAWRQALA
jgi:2-dehydrotetronate isomerase